MWKVIAAAVLWGTAGTAGLLITADPISVAAARLVIGGLVLAVLARGVTKLLQPDLLLAALAVAAYQLCFFAAVSRTGVAVGTVVAIGSGPVFTGLLSWLLHGQRPSRRWVLATLAAVVGCAALLMGASPETASGAAEAAQDIAQGAAQEVAQGAAQEVGQGAAQEAAQGAAQEGVREGSGQESLVGILLALLGGLLYAFYAVTAAHHIGRGADSSAVMGLMFGGAAVIMLPILIITGPAWLADPRSLLGALYLGLGTTALAYLLYGRGLRTTPVATAATLALAEPAVAALLGLFVLNESLTPLSVGGLLLLGASLVAVAVPERTPRAEAGVGGRRAG